jgi:hypothetical protein
VNYFLFPGADDDLQSKEDNDQLRGNSSFHNNNNNNNHHHSPFYTRAIGPRALKLGRHLSENELFISVRRKLLIFFLIFKNDFLL